MRYFVAMAVIHREGRTIGYEVTGEGEPVLLYHGTTMNRTAWDLVIASCPAGYAWVKVEFPGSGESSMPTGPIELDDIVDDSVAVMESLGATEFHVAGYSLGAVAALATAARHRARVKTVTSLCGWATTDARMRVTFDLWRRLIAVDNELFMRYALADGYTAGTLGLMESMLDDVVSMAAGTVAPGSDAHLELDIRVNIAQEVESIGCPALVIGGAEDRWVTPNHAHHLKELLPQSTLIELAAGHLVIQELAPQVAEALVAHISAN